MARDVENTVKTGNIQCISFYLGEEEFALDILNVREIIRVPDITRVPGSPEFIDGVLNLRGRVIPVINLHRRFGFPQSSAGRKNRIIVLETEGELIGIKVDAVKEVTFLTPETIKESPEILSNLDTQYIAGIAQHEERLIILVDSYAILSADQLRAVQELSPANQ